ncbi:MAG: ABC transporter substrate-binding protein [Chloroflexi bacterium]|nr:ABC transporter substrate-binding protein [Chloroflexota bacterium]
MTRLLVLSTLLLFVASCATTAPVPSTSPGDRGKAPAETATTAKVKEVVPPTAAAKTDTGVTAEAKKSLPPTETAKAKEAETKAAAKKEARLDRINLVYTILAPGTVPVWIAFDQGIYRKNGLDVEMEFSNATAAAAGALAGGKYQFSTMGGEIPVRLTVAGTPTVLLSVAANVMDFFIYSQASLTKPADLRGKKIGITRFGSGTDVATRAALRKFGLEPDRDYTIVQSGGSQESIIAVAAGGIDAATVGGGNWGPTAKKAGLNELLDIATLEIPFAQNGVGVTKDYLAKNEDVVRRFVRSYLEGIALARTDKELTKKTIRTYVKTEDEEILENGYRWITNLTKPAPYPLPAAVQQAIDTVAAEEEQAKSYKPEQFIEARFIKEMEDNGFIKSLYEKK